MTSNGKKIALGIAKFVIPAAIIAFLLMGIESHQWEELAGHPKNYGFLAVALLVAIAAMSVSFARWWILVRCQGIAFTLLEAFRLSSICYLLNFVSVGAVGGDLFKAIFLAGRRPGKRVEAVASVIVDRGCGLYGLLVVVSVALLIRDPSDGFAMGGQDGGMEINIADVKKAAVILFSVATAILAVLVFGGRFVDKMINAASSLPVIGGIIHHIGPPLRMFHHHPIAFAISIVMSAAVHAMLVISFYLIALALYPAPPTLAEHFVIVPLSLLVSALPLTPAGVGLLELAMDQLYKIVPAVKTSASGILVALVFDIVKIVMAVIGTIFYWTANEEVRHSLEVAEEEATHHHDLTDLAEDGDIEGESIQDHPQV